MTDNGKRTFRVRERSLRMGAALLVVAGILFVAGRAGAGEFAVQAVVDRNVIDPSETVELSVVITGGSGDVDLSPLERDFRIVSQGTSTNLQIVNMQMTRETRSTYGLAPLREGRLTIPALTVRSGKNEVTTKPIAITVRAGGPGHPGGGDEPAPAGTRDAFVEAVVSDTSPWLGQPIEYIFRFARRVQIADARFEKPSFAGFSPEEGGDEKTFRTVIGGVEYQVTELRYRLLPLAPGRQTIEPGVLVAKVPGARTRQPTRRGIFPFDDPFFSRGRGNWRSRSFRSGEVVVEVRKLPPMPPDLGEFSGLMGTFALASSLDPSTVTAGDSATLTLTITGTGNVAEAAAPEFTVPPSVRVYPDQPEPATGDTKIFRFALVPNDAGTVNVGPFRLNYFDPEAGEYRLAKAEEGTILVTGAATPPPPPELTVGEERTETDGAEIEAERVAAVIRTVRRPGVAGAFVGIVLFLFVGWKVGPVIARRIRERDRETGRLKAAARVAVATARGRVGGDPTAWADAVYEVILLAARLRSGSAVPPSPEELGVLFDDGTEDAGVVEDVLRRIEEARFGGGNLDADARREVTRQAAALVDRSTRKK